jgi:hypothetical protein
MRRVEEVEERRRAAALQVTMSLRGTSLIRNFQPTRISQSPKYRADVGS